MVEHIDVIVKTMALTVPEASVTGSLEATALLFPLKVSCSFFAGGVTGDKDIPKRGQSLSLLWWSC